MQIRVQGLKIQCLRSEYDQGKKRSIQKLVASLPIRAQTIEDGDETALAPLTPDERQQLIVWLAGRQELIRGYTVRRAPEMLQEVANAITEGETALDAAYVASLWVGMARLAKALRKTGNPKPVRTKKKSENGD